MVVDAKLPHHLVQRIIFENLRQPSTIKRTLNQVYMDTSNVDDELVEAIRKPSLDKGAFNVFKSVFDPAGPQGKPLDELFSQLKAPLLLLCDDLQSIQMLSVFYTGEFF